jgi:hypothetical protein
MPDLNPVRTGSEMTLTMKSKRRMDASTSMAPTSSASVALATINAAGSPPGTVIPN